MTRVLPLPVRAYLPLRLICLSISAGRRDFFWRRGRKLRHLLEQTHVFAGQKHEASCVTEVEEREMKKFRTVDLRDEHFEPLTYNLERLS